jgi:hypothetical protein
VCLPSYFWTLSDFRTQWVPSYDLWPFQTLNHKPFPWPLLHYWFFCPTLSPPSWDFPKIYFSSFNSYIVYLLILVPTSSFLFLIVHNINKQIQNNFSSLGAVMLARTWRLYVTETHLNSWTKGHHWLPQSENPVAKLALEKLDPGPKELLFMLFLCRLAWCSLVIDKTFSIWSQHPSSTVIKKSPEEKSVWSNFGKHSLLESSLRPADWVQFGMKYISLRMGSKDNTWLWCWQITIEQLGELIWEWVGTSRNPFEPWLWN